MVTSDERHEHYCHYGLMSSMLKWTLSRHQARIRVRDYLAGYVDVPRFAALCQGCPSLGTTWACPPHETDPLRVWRGHEWLHLEAVQLHFSQADQQRAWTPAALSEQLMVAREAEKQLATSELIERVATLPSARVLHGGGACAACAQCTRMRGMPCPFPHLIQYSVESLGGDVGRTATELLGVELHWAGPDRLPPATAVVLGVLSDHEELPRPPPA